MNKGRLFLGCFLALVATAVGFAIRSQLIEEWAIQFEMSETQKGNILGAGLYPFVISIMLFSLIVDRIGYGTAMVAAFVFHVLSAVMTIWATDYTMLYWATVIFALANGTVEAVINPVTATLYPNQKTHYLNILHAGWPGGLVVGSLIGNLMNNIDGASLPGLLWQWKFALVFIPTIIYGVLLVGQKFPPNERVEAGVTYEEMVGQFFRPLFLFLVIIMVPLAITELGTDSWMTDIMNSVIGTTYGGYVLTYTSIIMFILRFFAGPIVHKISPLGLLAASAAFAILGLLGMSQAESFFLVFVVATVYAIGKTFFWPTMLGVVSEQYPKGGALTLNGISGVGMLSVGLLGTTLMGSIQDKVIHNQLEERPELQSEYAEEEESGILGKYRPLDKQKVDALPDDSEEKLAIMEMQKTAKRQALAWTALFPTFMLVCYIGLILYFQSKGGYKPVVISGENEGGPPAESASS